MVRNDIKISAVLCLSLVLAPCAWAAGAKPTPVEQQIIDNMQAGAPTILRLWPDGSPRNQSRNGKEESGKLTDKLRVYNIEKPSLLVYAPPEGVKRLDAAIIHCPGGGYNYLAMANPQQFTQWMNHLGITVAVLKYNAPRSKADPQHLGPLADAQRALRLLRSKASDFGLSPDKIGISGASAGGHLGFHACLKQGTPSYEPIDAIDKLSCRPAFGLLFYPAYLSKGKQVALHPDLNPELLGKETPPIFMTINGDDRGFVMGNLGAMVAMHDKKVPSELHVWTKGGHSGCTDKYPLVEFARPAARFLVRREVLPEAALARNDAWLDTMVAKLRKPSAPSPKMDAPKPPAGIEEAQLTVIDQALRKAAGRDLPVYRLWPGEGNRTDDPYAGEGESLKQRNVPIASNITVPTMTYYPAAKSHPHGCGRGVLVFPGGGYGALAWEHEGTKVAEWLNEQGVHAFLVKYRTPRRKGLDKHHVALQDAQRAMRLVRSQAKAFGVQANKIGVLGFSAGGHLAALTGTTLEGQTYAPIDQHDKVSSVADFRVLIYPAYTTTKMDNDEIDPLLMSEQAGVPTFVATAADDKYTRGQYFYLGGQLMAKTPLAYHVYENGGHGKGILDVPVAFSQWPRECARWLQDLDR